MSNNKEYKLNKERIRSRYRNLLGEKYALIFEKDTRIHTPKLPSKDLSEYGDRRDTAQNRLDNESEQLDYETKQANRFYTSRKKRRSRRRARWLKFSNGWKSFLYILWLMPLLSMLVAVARDQDYLSYWADYISDLIALHWGTWIFTGIWIGLLIVLKFLSKINVVILRLVVNSFYTVVFGLVATLFILITLDAFI